MPIATLYESCLTCLLSTRTNNQSSLLHPAYCTLLPDSCLRDLLPHLSSRELERFESIYTQRRISIGDLWRRHFEFIWSLSRDDKDTYESISDIPYKRLFFEYLFHDTQILQLGIYVHIQQIEKAKCIIDISLIEQIKYNLTRNSIIYCAKKRLIDNEKHLALVWNSKWNEYIQRFIFVPNVWNLANIDLSLIDFFTQHITHIVLSGYPTENDTRGMKFILDILTCGHINSIVLKFPSYCLMNILLPLLIYPRSYSLSYLSNENENDLRRSRSDLSILKRRLILPRQQRRRNLCLQVQINSENENEPINRFITSMSHHHSITNENNSIDTTHAIISHSMSSRSHTTNSSFDLLASPPNTVLNVRSSSQTIMTDIPQLILQRHLISDNVLPSNPPHERLLPYLNRSRTLLNFPHLPSQQVVPTTRHLSVSILQQPTTTLLPQPLSSSDSNLFQRPTPTATVQQPPSKMDELVEEKTVILQLTPQNQTSTLTHLSIYYVSAFETIEMIAIALIGMHQISHLTLVNFGLYSSQLETSLITLCLRTQLQSLHLSSITLVHGAIGFLRTIFQSNNEDDHHRKANISLVQLRLDTIKIFLPLIDGIHLADVERAQFNLPSPLTRLFWRERHIQYIHIRLLFKLLTNALPQLSRLELASILECSIFDQSLPWCYSLIDRLADVRLRNFRIRSNNLHRLFLALNTHCHLNIFHFERAGLTWTHSQVTQAFTSLVLRATHLLELNLAYNNLDGTFIDWLCETLLLFERKKLRWSISIFNLNFNLITNQSIRRLLYTLNEYKELYRIGRSPIRRLDFLGNGLELNEIVDFKKQFNALGCDFISYISTYSFLFLSIRRTDLLKAP